MKKNEDPDKKFEQLSGLENRYNTTSFNIPDEDLITTVFEKTPKEYGMILTCKQRTKGNNFELKDLNEAMMQLY
eukprot:4368151-Ditylum_brightwellii.AAC.1